ncbi:MAG: hypothetical protein PHY72_00595 [Candidatus Pacebacteria bacterium]|nr:hypothetical protein [Candidatus Paceibacterota bacterium]
MKKKIVSLIISLICLVFLSSLFIGMIFGGMLLDFSSGIPKIFQIISLIVSILTGVNIAILLWFVEKNEKKSGTTD